MGKKGSIKPTCTSKKKYMQGKGSPILWMMLMMRLRKWRQKKERRSADTQPSRALCVILGFWLIFPQRYRESLKLSELENGTAAPITTQVWTVGILDWAGFFFPSPLVLQGSTVIRFGFKRAHSGGSVERARL